MADEADVLAVLHLQQDASMKRPRLEQSTITKSKVQSIRELTVGLIVDADLPFSIFDNRYFKELLHQFDAQLADQVPCGKITQRNDLHKLYQAKKVVIMQELELVLTKIHLSFDLWTSPNRHAMMAIIAHFIDNHKRQQTLLLALRRQLGAHSGENLAVTLVDVVSSWGIVNKVGTVICDNASNNDSCLRAFYLQLDPSMELKDIKARRMRCYGHILNLVARAFLFGKDADSFELQSEAHKLLSQQEADLYHWRQQGPIGKLHNIIKFIRASPQRSERFKKRAQETETEEYRLYEESTAELELIQNNETRWNSTYLMIQRAFTKRAEITAYFIELEHNPTDHDHLAAEDNLTIDDWRLLGEIMHLLKPLYDQTMRTQGWGRGDGHGRLWEVMTGIEYLLEHLEDWKTFYDEATTETAAQAASQVVPGPLSPPLSQQVLLPPSTPSTQVSARSVRAHQLPAQLNGCEVNTLLRGSRSH